MSHDFPIYYRNKRQFWNKGRTMPQGCHQILLMAVTVLRRGKRRFYNPIDCFIIGWLLLTNIHETRSNLKSHA